MSEFQTKKSGFTLAEALLTLLIISIVVALSTVIIAKKNKKMKANNQTHYWLCTRNSYNGTHIQDSNAATSSTAGSSSCTFVPPVGVNKFNVTVIGGGGGGGSGFSSRETEQFYTRGSHIFRPGSSGSFYIILVGGGGAGGGRSRTCGRWGANGGFSGAMINDYFDLSSSSSYSVVVGKAGPYKDGKKSGIDGEASTFSGGGISLIAGGGGGGRRRTSDFIGCSDKGGGQSATYSPTNVNGSNSAQRNAKIGGKLICNDEETACNFPEVASYLPSGHKHAGNGGNGGMTQSNAGTDGVAMIQNIKAYGGGGGQAGKLAFYQYKQSPGPTVVVAGEGGTGADKLDTDGNPGSASRFGTKVIAGGGAGGLKRATRATAGFVVNGEIGSRSLMPTNLVSGYSSSTASGGNGTTDGGNGSTPGSGGGGGGADADEGTWTKGGKGAPGIVIVTW